MILGIHGSVRAGLPGALDEAEAAGVKALQLLPYRRHHLPTPEELAAFRARREASAVTRLIVHSRFVPSLASADEARRGRSVELLALELELAQGLGAETFIIHAGAYSPGDTAENGLRRCGESIAQAAGSTDFKGTILIENVPGGGRRLGAALEEIARLRESTGARAKSGVCLDTAHAWAAGYDLSSAEGALKFLARAHRLFGEDVLAFHLNDSRARLNSRREDHAHWGEGFLGREGLATLLSREEYADTPAILETPKTPGGDRRNLEFVGALS